MTKFTANWKIFTPEITNLNCVNKNEFILIQYINYNGKVFQKLVIVFKSNKNNSFVAKLNAGFIQSTKFKIYFQKKSGKMEIISNLMLLQKSSFLTVSSNKYVEIQLNDTNMKTSCRFWIYSLNDALKNHTLETLVINQLACFINNHF